MQALILLHVATGALAVAAGAVALLARKGGGLHVAAGRGFAVSMAVSSLSGAALGLLDYERFYITFHAGLLTLCLIAGGWMTARQKDARLGAAGAAVGLVNLANAAGLAGLGALAAETAQGTYLGFAAGDYVFLAGMAAIAVIGDASLLLRARLSRRHRIARHLWRMCLGFFIAAGSAFTGPGAKVFPEALRQSGLLSAPELAIIVLMAFWLVRTVFFQSPPKQEAQDPLR